MTETLGTLFQSNPTATTLTDVLTVGGGTSVVSSGVWVANRSATATSFRFSVAPGAAADDNKQYLFFDTPIAGNATMKIAEGCTWAAGTVIRVYATLATLSFNGFGSVVTTT